MCIMDIYMFLNQVKKNINIYIISKTWKINNTHNHG